MQSSAKLKNTLYHQKMSSYGDHNGDGDDDDDDDDDNDEELQSV